MPASKLTQEMRDSQVRMETQLKDLTVQLLGGEGRKGVIPHLFEKHEELMRHVNDADTEIKKDVEVEIKGVTKRVDKVEKTLVWFSGCAAAIGFGFSWVWHFIFLHADQATVGLKK